MEATGGVLLFFALGLWLLTSGLDWSACRAPFAAMTLVGFVLFQGIIYWSVKLDAIARKRPVLSVHFKALFLGFKYANWILFGAYAYWLVRIFPDHTLPFGWLTTSWCIYGFAILEYINYYHYQLSHDNAADVRYLKRYRRLRVSALALDLADA